VPVICRRCGSTDFRTSRFRLQDLRRLLFLQLPVRCRSCQLRTFTFLPNLFKIRRDAKLRRREKAAARDLQHSAGRRD
jgi:hypothetical protein